ncbi:MAG: hypothetical protein WBW32_02770 [Luteibacter sp.]
MPHPVPASNPVRGENLRALCRVLEARGLEDSRRIAVAFGPSMTPERLSAALAGAPLPDFLARSIEHMMGVQMFWLDEPHPDVTEPAGNLLVEHALRLESAETIPPVWIADFPSQPTPD